VASIEKEIAKLTPEEKSDLLSYFYTKDVIPEMLSIEGAIYWGHHWGSQWQRAAMNHNEGEKERLKQVIIHQGNIYSNTYHRPDLFAKYKQSIEEATVDMFEWF